MDGEDPTRWAVRPLKRLNYIKQGPGIWSLKSQFAFTSIGFIRTDYDYSVYIYHRNGMRIIISIHVDDLLLAFNSRSAIQRVKA